MTGNNFHEVVQLIRKEDNRYAPGAYNLIRQGLDFTLNRIRKQEENLQSRHITGQELCHGLKDLLLEQFGPMAFTLLAEWGIHRTEDFGQIVFNLVEFGVFGKTDKDDVADFSNVYDFEEVFVRPFQPTKQSARNMVSHCLAQLS